MFTFAAEAATGWALVGYIGLIIATISLIPLISYLLYRLGMWFITVWFGERLGLSEATDLPAE